MLLSRFDAASRKWLSLDVFDTLLWRPVERPTDVFFDVHRRLGEQRSIRVSPQELVQHRVAAEVAARRDHPSGEVTLDEIAVKLSHMLGGTPDTAALIDAELAAELACLELDLDIAALVEHAAQRGVPYVLVSDMYLPAEHIAALVAAASERAGRALPAPAHVFVSGERRTGKASRLFDDVLSTLGGSAADVFHVGDHPRSDVEAPARRGIAVFHYTRENAWVERVVNAEAQLLPPGVEGRPDLGLRTLRAKAVARSADGTDAVRHVDYGNAILGPLLTLFAEWVVADCARHGQEVVYCLMREGHVLAPLVEKAARAASVRLDVRTLWASRYALRAAAFHHGSEVELRDYLTKRDGTTLATVARDLGLDEGLVRHVARIDHGGALSAGDRDRLVVAVTSDEPLRAQVREASAAKRGKLFRHFEREGVFARDRLTLVDLGWAGTIQRTLAQAFREQPRPLHVRGLYLATHAKLLELPAATCSAESYLVRLGEPADVWAILSRTPEILEQACMAPEGSFRGVGDDDRLVHFPQSLPTQQLHEIAEIQRGIFQFAELWLPGAAARRAGSSLADEAALLSRLRAILVRSIESPTREEVRLFERWAHDTNDGSAHADALLGSAELRRRAGFMSYEEIRALSWLDCYWPQGLACLVGRSPRPGRRLWQRVLGNDVVRAAVSAVSRSRSVLARKIEGE